MQRQTPGFRHGSGRFVHTATAKELLWGELVQNRSQGLLDLGEGGIEQAAAGGDGEGEHHTVGTAGLCQVRFTDRSKQFFRPWVQGVSMDGVAVLCEQLSQLYLAHIAAHNPEIQFPIHGLSLLCCADPDYAGKEGRVPRGQEPEPEKTKKARPFQRDGLLNAEERPYLAALAALMASMSMGVTLNRSPQMP